MVNWKNTGLIGLAAFGLGLAGRYFYLAERALSTGEELNRMLNKQIEMTRTIISESKQNLRVYEESLNKILNAHQQTGLSLYPEFMFNQNTTSSWDRFVLEALLKERKPNTAIPVENTCLFEITDLTANGEQDYLSESRIGSCVFLTNGWILATYHQVEQSTTDALYTVRSRTITITTSHEEKIKSKASRINIKVAAISPREDLALLITDTPIPYLQSLCVQDIPVTLTSARYVTLYEENEDRKPHAREIRNAKREDEITFHTTGELTYYAVKFTPKKPLIPGESGSPVYDSQGCLIGIINKRNEDRNEGFYSPRVRTFIERYLASTSTTNTLPE